MSQVRAQSTRLDSDLGAGNPGLLNYYIPFLNHLHSLLPDTHAIISTSHIGHSTDLPHPSRALDLPAQLEAKVELVRALRADIDAWSQRDGVHERPTLALMGHSVGSWFLTEVKKRLASEVDVGYMLFPTVGWIKDSWNGRTLWVSGRSQGSWTLHPVNTDGVQPIFRWPIRSLLPTISPLLRPILPVTTFPPTTLSLLRSSPTIHHCLELSKSEMDVIRDPDLDWFTAEGKLGRGKGLYGIWSAGNLDGWVGREGPLVRDCLGGEEGSRVKVLEGVPHAFCLSKSFSY